MKYYLKKSETIFYDDHGEAERGGINKEVGTQFDYPGVTRDGKYIDKNDYYLYSNNKKHSSDIKHSSNIKYFLEPEDWEEVVMPHAEDGYHFSCIFYQFKQITQEEFLDYLEIIGKYNQI